MDPVPNVHKVLVEFVQMEVEYNVTYAILAIIYQEQLVLAAMVHAYNVLELLEINAQHANLQHL